jgi:PAS domain S-box-containing protein
MAVVSQVALIGAAGRPFDETVSRATDGLARLWPDAVLGFLFVDEADQSLHLHHSYHGVSPEMRANLRIPLDQGLVGWAMREQQPVRMGNAAADSRYIAFVEGTLSKMVAPLMVGGRVIGTINVECPWPNAYSGDDLRVLMALASQLATIFEKARLDAALAEHAATLEQRVAERTAELRQAEAKYRTLVEQTPAVTYTAALDENHSLLYISPQIEALTGLAPAAWLAEPGLRFKRLHPDDRQRVLDELARAIDCNSAFRSEYRLLAQEGRVVWVRDEGRLVCDEGGRPICVQGILLDVTERKQAEEEIRRALEKEKELNELKSRFVSMASHEFRTPLTGILSSAELLQEYGARWTEERKLVHLRRIQASVQHMTSLLNDVLVIGKADAGKLEFKPAPLDLVKLCRELVEEMQLSAGAKHTLTFASQVKSAPASMDENLLRHIVSNLLSNAIKYSPQGGEVQCTLTCQADQAILQVKDQGIGIPLEDQAHLFETFHRASNIRNIPGTGLGLAIVKRSVDSHGGTINVSSQVGVGTTVTVTLPLGVSNGE